MVNFHHIHRIDSICKAASCIALSTAAMFLISQIVDQRHTFNFGGRTGRPSIRRLSLSPFSSADTEGSSGTAPFVANALDVYEEHDESLTKDIEHSGLTAPSRQIETQPETDSIVTNIALIGERHSGTNWMTDHLEKCFGEDLQVRVSYSRFKHWFQFDYTKIQKKSTVVVAMFRDPYDWVEAMRERPHHAHGHMNLNWRDFVTKPWEGPRGLNDKFRLTSAGGLDEVIEEVKSTCLANYTWNEVIPCAEDDAVQIDGYARYMYELMHDKSGRAYPSIVDLRREKILNFLSMPEFRGVKHFYPIQYEEMNRFGTSSLLKKLEEATGKKAKCEGYPASGSVHHKQVDPEYVYWMNKFVDWEVESLIGYSKRQPAEAR